MYTFPSYVLHVLSSSQSHSDIVNLRGHTEGFKRVVVENVLLIWRWLSNRPESKTPSFPLILLKILTIESWRWEWFAYYSSALLSSPTFFFFFCNFCVSSFVLRWLWWPLLVFLFVEFVQDFLKLLFWYPASRTSKMVTYSPQGSGRESAMRNFSSSSRINDTHFLVCSCPCGYKCQNPYCWWHLKWYMHSSRGITVYPLITLGHQSKYFLCKNAFPILYQLILDGTQESQLICGKAFICCQARRHEKCSMQYFN